MVLASEPSSAQARLQEACGTTSKAAAFTDSQKLDHLNGQMQAFTAAATEFTLATANGAGELHCAIRRGPAGFLQVLGPKLLAWPDYPGNGVMDSLANLAEHHQLGLLIIDRAEVIGLHINGGGMLLTPAQAVCLHPDLADPPDAPPARRAARWVWVTVSRAFIQCRKHLVQPGDPPGPGPSRPGTDYFGAAAGQCGPP